MEEWRKIQDFENYEVSNLGFVRNITTGKILKNRLSDGRYFTVVLSVNNIPKSKRVSRLVAEAFIPNPNNKEFIDHINHDKTNNRVENLRWCSASENMMNKKIKSTNTSGVCGVRWSQNKWKAQISINNKKNHLGSYNSIEEATEVRRKAEVEYFGEFRYIEKEG